MNPERSGESCLSSARLGQVAVPAQLHPPVGVTGRRARQAGDLFEEAAGQRMLGTEGVRQGELLPASRYHPPDVPVEGPARLD